MNIEECYQILDLMPGEPRNKVDESFRILDKVWQPDRFAHNPRLQARAQEKLKEIRAAKTILDEYLTTGKEPQQRGESFQAIPSAQKETQSAREQEADVERKRQDEDRRKQEKERILRQRAQAQEERLQRDKDAATEQAQIKKDQRHQKEKQKREHRAKAKLSSKANARRQLAGRIILAIMIMALIIFLYRS
jgi:cobalamin biosynthesis Mg chelatase CobN